MWPHSRTHLHVSICIRHMCTYTSACMNDVLIYVCEDFGGKAQHDEQLRCPSEVRCGVMKKCFLDFDGDIMKLFRIHAHLNI